MSARGAARTTLWVAVASMGSSVLATSDPAVVLAYLLAIAAVLLWTTHHHDHKR